MGRHQRQTATGVTVARVFVPADQLHGARVELQGDPHRHLIKVLRLSPGARVGVFDGTGVEIDAVVVAADRRSVTLQLGARRQIPPPPVAITLIQAVPRGDRMEWVIQKSTELGVARIIPVTSARTVVRGGRTGATASEQPAPRWQTIAAQAARQCGRADMPRLEAVQPVDDGVRMAVQNCQGRLVLWENAQDRSLPDALAALVGPTQRRPDGLCLMVGAEGGWSDEEIAHAQSLGFEAVTMGPRILRSETAAIAALAVAQAALGGFALTAP